jgi:hypothetical protein
MTCWQTENFQYFPVVPPLQDRPNRQVRQSFRSSTKGAAQSNSSSEEGEGAKCRLLDFTQSNSSPYLWLSMLFDNTSIIFIGVNNVSERDDDLLQRNIDLERKLQVFNSTIGELKSKLKEMNSRNEELSLNLYSYFMENDDLKVYYTRFSKHAFESIFEDLLQIKENNNFACDLRRKFFITLLKLPHNFGLRD